MITSETYNENRTNMIHSSPPDVKALATLVSVLATRNI